MAEQDTGAPAQEQKPTEGDGDTETAEADQADETREGDDGEEGEEGDEEEEPEDDGHEPEVRKGRDYFIGLRKGKKAARERQPDKGETDETPEGEDDEDIDPRDLDLVRGLVKELTDPVLQEVRKQQDESTVQQFLSEHPDFKPYEAKARRYMEHPSRQHLPIGTVFMEAAGIQGLLKIGARRARESDANKQRSQGGGSSTRSQPSKGDVWDMDQKSFREQQEAVRRKFADR